LREFYAESLQVYEHILQVYHSTLDNRLKEDADKADHAILVNFILS